MKDIYFTLTGCNHYLGTDFMKPGMKVKLVKEPDNKYDTEAIMVKIKGMGKCGYVANSPYTVLGESMSAGRLYDKIGDKAKGKIIHVLDGCAICELKSRVYMDQILTPPMPIKPDGEVDTIII